MPIIKHEQDQEYYMKEVKDIKKTEVKKVKNDKWQFKFRENGYVILSLATTKIVKKKQVLVWMMHLHGTNLESCLQYVWKSYNGNIKPIKYEDLETV